MVSRHALVDGNGSVSLVNAKLVAETMGFVWDAFFMKKILKLAMLCIQDMNRQDEEDG